MAVVNKWAMEEMMRGLWSTERVIVALVAYPRTKLIHWVIHDPDLVQWPDYLRLSDVEWRPKYARVVNLKTSKRVDIEVDASGEFRPNGLAVTKTSGEFLWVYSIRHDVRGLVVSLDFGQLMSA